jgi:hypothetical protein
MGNSSFMFIIEYLCLMMAVLLTNKTTSLFLQLAVHLCGRLSREMDDKVIGSYVDIGGFAREMVAMYVRGVAK